MIKMNLKIKWIILEYKFFYEGLLRNSLNGI